MLDLRAPHATGTAGHDPGAMTLGFDLHVQGARAALVLVGRTVLGWLRVERLELEIPGLDFPLDLAGGAIRFQRRRGRVATGRLAIDDAGLEALLWARGAELGAAGFTELSARVLDGTIELSARARVGERSAELLVRAACAPAGRGVRIIVSDARAFGFLGRPPRYVAHDLLCALAAPAPAGDDAPPPWSPIVRGLADVELRPLDAALWGALPAAGWRLPDATGAHVAGLRATRGRLVIDYVHDVDGAKAPPPERALPAGLAAGDARLLTGELDAAAAAYRGELARGGAGATPALERLLGVLLGHEATLGEADQLAREAIGRVPDFRPGHAALGSVAAERGAPAEAAEHWARVVELAEEAGDDEEAVRAALAAARLLRGSDPARATPLYERVFERRPGHAEAAEALVESYGAEERWTDLLRLARRRIAATADRREQAREHVRLGEVYLARVGDAERAREELERATKLHDGDPRAWDGLARALGALGDAHGAIRSLDRLAHLHGAKADTLGEARTHARIAAMWEVLGDDGGAQLRYRRALELCPDDLDVLERLGGVAARRGQLDEAIECYERLAQLAVAGDERRRSAARQLGRLLTDAGEPERARRALDGAAGGGDEEEGERLALLARLEEQSGRPEWAVTLLEQAAALAVPAPLAAQLELDLARLYDARGRPDEADRARERAVELHRAAAVAEAAPALAERARARGDHAAEARWLDELLAEGSAELHPEAALRRADLALDTGDPARALQMIEAAGDAADPRAAGRLRAEALFALGQLAESADACEALAADAPPAEAVTLLATAARARLAAGDLRAARDAARGTLAVADALALGSAAPGESAPAVREARRVLTEAAWQLEAWGDVVAALAPLVEAVDGETSEPDDALRLGAALERLERGDEALAVYRRATGERGATGETLAMAWRRLVELHERRGEHEPAARALAAAAADPRTGEPQLARAEAHHRAAELLRKRLALPDRAIAELEAALRLVPDHLPSLDALEAIHGEAGSEERVAAILGRKIAATARHPERQKALLVRLAELQRRLGRPDAAREAYHRAVELDPQLPAALAYLAHDARERGDGSAAEAYLVRLVQGAADSGERVPALLALAELARDSRRPADGERWLRLALDCDPAPETRCAILGALEALYAGYDRWSDAAAVLAQRAVAEPTAVGRAAAEVRRAEVLLGRLDDAAGALVACRRAREAGARDAALARIWAEAARTAEDEAALAEALALGEAAAAPTATTPAPTTSAPAAPAPTTPAPTTPAPAAPALTTPAPAAPAPTTPVATAFAAAPTADGTDDARDDAVGALEDARALLAADDDAAARARLAGVRTSDASDELLLLRAELYEEGGAWRDAVRDLAVVRERAERRGDRDAEAAVARRLATITLERLHDDRTAERLYERALVLDPDDLAAAEGLVAVHERRGDRGRTVAALERVLDLARRPGAPDGLQVEVRRQLARHLRARGDLVGARTHLDQACALAPRDVLARRDRAALAAALGDYEDAARWLVALAEEPDESGAPVGEIYAELADVYELRLHDRARAVEALRRAAGTSEGERREALLRRAALLADGAGGDAEVGAAAPGPRPDADVLADLERRVEALEADGRYATAADALAHALRERARDLAARGEPLDDAARGLLARLRTVAHVARHLEPLADGLVAAAAAEPDENVAAGWFAEAAALRRDALGDQRGAADALGRALALRPADAAIVAELDALLAVGDPGRRVEAYELHLRALHGPARAPALVALARLVGRELGDAARAERLFAEARAADPDHAGTLVPSADGRYQAGDRAAAEELYRRALDAGAVDPADRARVLVRLGELAVRRDDAATALPPLREALPLVAPRPELDEDDGAAARYAEACGWLDRALRAAHEWGAVTDLLLQRAGHAADRDERLALLRDAVALLDGPLGEAERAAEVYREIAALDRDDVVAGARAARPAETRAEEAEDPAAELAPTPTRADDWRAVLARLDRDARLVVPADRAAVLAEAATIAADRLGDPAGALARLDVAVAASIRGEERTRLRAARAELAARLGRHAQARTEASELLAAGPPLGLAHLALGRVHVSEGDPEAALPHLAAAADRADLPDALAVEANLLAGHAHQALGQLESACGRYEQASALDPFDARPLDALEQIGELRADHELIVELLGRRLVLCERPRERAELWARRAAIYRDVLHREPESYRCLKEAVAHDPTYLEAAQALRTLAMARGEWALCAELLYREIEAAHEPTERAALHLELALVYEERLLDVDAAIRNYESALALDPDGPVPPAALARLYALAQRPEDAARAEERAAAFEGSPVARAERLYRAGDHLERAGHPERAARLYAAAGDVPDGGDPAAAGRLKAARLGGERESPAAQRERLLAAIRRTNDPTERLSSLRQLLRLAIEAGDEDELDLRTHEVLLRDPGDVTAFLERRRLLAARGDWVELADLYRSRADVLDDSKERAAVLFDLGRICVARLGDAARATIAFEGALRDDPGHLPALDFLADLAYRHHDWERAHLLYGRLDPEASFHGRDVVHLRRGEIAEMLGHEDAAQDGYRAAAAANPSLLAAHEALARLALYRGQLTAAIAALRDVLDLLPLDDVERITATRQQLGELCQRAGNGAAARGYFELVLAEDPGRVAALVPLADLYAHAGLWSRAADVLGRLSRLVASPEKRADLLYRMGEVYRLQLGDDERASDAYLKSIDLDPRHLPTMRRLIDYYWATGDDASLAEIAAELDARGELVAPDTPHEVVARAAVSVARGGDLRWGTALARALGDAAAGALASVLADAAARRPPELDRLVTVARTLCVPPGPSLDAVRAVLVVRAPKDPHAEALVARL